MRSLYAKYKDRGLVVVGVHTPEFLFERSASSVQAALKRDGITYPVTQDNDSLTWHAYRNPRSTSSTKAEKSCSNMTAKASTNKSIAPSRAC